MGRGFVIMIGISLLLHIVAFTWISLPSSAKPKPRSVQLAIKFGKPATEQNKSVISKRGEVAATGRQVSKANGEQGVSGTGSFVSGDVDRAVAMAQLMPPGISDQHIQAMPIPDMSVPSPEIIPQGSVNDPHILDSDEGATGGVIPFFEDASQGFSYGNVLDDDGNVLTYERVLALWLDKHRRYPEVAKRDKLSGAAVVRIKINREGKVILFDITTSTGHKSLDEALVAMIKKANYRVPPPPDEYQDISKHSFEIEFRFTYEQEATEQENTDRLDSADEGSQES